MQRKQVLLLTAAVLVTAMAPTSVPAVAQVAPWQGATRTPAIPPRPAARFSWPLPAPHPVVRPFRRPANPYGPGHRGVDLGGRAGQPVMAAGDGTITFAGPVVDRNVVTIRHLGGLRTTYEPVEPIVTAGERVLRGQLIGHLLAGHSPCAAAACLHWGLRIGTEYFDPLGLLAVGHVRLLPWRPVSLPNAPPASPTV